MLLCNYRNIVVSHFHLVHAMLNIICDTLLTCYCLWQSCEKCAEGQRAEGAANSQISTLNNSPTLYSATQLVEQLKSLKPDKTQQDGLLTIGLVS